MVRPPPLLVGPRVTVALVRDTDAAALLAFHRRNREHLKPWSPPAPDAFFTMAYWRQWAAQAHRFYDQEQAIRLVIRRRDDPDGPVIGQINFSNILRGPFQAADLGYHIDRDHEGQGLMAEALRLAIGFAFERCGLHRIMANHRPENMRSGRLLARLGFETEGYARDFLFIDGAWRDHVLTALVNPRAAPPAADEAAPGRPAGPARPNRHPITGRGRKV